MGKNKEGLEIHCAEGRYEVFADQILWSELTGEKNEYKSIKQKIFSIFLIKGPVHIKSHEVLKAASED